jgi:hypothetical protein
VQSVGECAGISGSWFGAAATVISATDSGGGGIPKGDLLPFVWSQMRRRNRRAGSNRSGRQDQGKKKGGVAFMELFDVYHIVVCIGPVSHLDPVRLSEQPGLAVYRVREDATDLAQEIDMALLDHLHCWSTTVFVGGELARREAASYHITCLSDSPSVNSDLMEFWRTTAPVPDCP